MTLGEAYNNVRDCVSAVGTDEDKEAIIVIRKALAEALKPSHNTGSPKCPACSSVYIWYSANGLAAKCDSCGHKWSRALRAGA